MIWLMVQVFFANGFQWYEKVVVGDGFTFGSWQSGKSLLLLVTGPAKTMHSHDFTRWLNNVHELANHGESIYVELLD